MTTYPAKKLKRTEKPKPCIECRVNLADPPSKLCPDCQAYKEHLAMTPSNSAYYECPKGRNKLHTWSPIIENDTRRIGAMCLNCNLVLTAAQADEVFEDNSK